MVRSNNEIDSDTVRSALRAPHGAGRRERWASGEIVVVTSSAV